jgi:hypothetical protein
MTLLTIRRPAFPGQGARRVSGPARAVPGAAGLAGPFCPVA